MLGSELFPPNVCAPAGGKIAGLPVVVLRVLARSSHVFGVLATAALWSPATRRLAISVLGALALGILTSLPAASPSAVHLVTAPAASSPWLDRVNSWRASTGLSALTENPTWSQGDAAHALYMVKNNLVTHYETPGVPYYTAAGDTEARNSNIQVSSSTGTTDVQAIDWWMAAPFHAMAMMDPRLSQTGFGSYRDSTTSPWQEGGALDTIQGNSFSGGSYPVYFPGNGATEPLTTYGGGEFPDPLQACPGYSAPTGLPVFIQVGGNLNTTAGVVHSFTGNGVALNHSVIDSSNSAVSSYLYTRGGVILVPQQPLQVGVRYVVALTVNGTPYTWSFTVGNFIACAAVTVTAAPPSQATAGTTVVFTASASGCPNPNPVYEFWMLAPGASIWTLAQAYSTGANFTWTTTGKTAGAYGISVWARDANSSGTSGNSAGRWDTYNSSQYTLTSAVGGTPCTGLSVSSSPASTAKVGVPVALTAGAIGCPAPTYQFWVLAPGASSWAVAQAYSSSATFNWTTTGKAAGTYGFSVWARDAGSAGTSGNSSGTWDIYNSSQYTLTGSGTPCASVSLASSPSGTASVGTPVTFTAAASGCPSPSYQFWILAPGATSWAVAQAYSTSAALNWTTTGKVAGTYGLSVWARDASSAGTSGNSSGTWDAYSSNQYALTGGARPCASVSLTSSPSGTASEGTPVTFSAAASGCPNPAYQFWVLAPGATSWTLAQAYSTSATLSWTTAGKLAGTYHLSVWVRDASSAGTSGNSSGTWDAYNSSQYALTGATTPCTSVSVTSSPSGTATIGTTVTFTAGASGCPNPTYQFWVLAPGATSWTLAQAYSTSATLTWSTTGKTAGTYHVSVWVRDASSAGTSGNSSGSWDAYNSNGYALT
jgi:uncharacterized protein YkwD